MQPIALGKNASTELRARFALFLQWVQYYQDVLGMMDWTIRVGAKALPPDECGNSIGSPDTRVGRINMNSRVNFTYGEDEVRRTALHELLHILMWKTIQLGNLRCVGENEIDTQHERDIVHLENALIRLEDGVPAIVRPDKVPREAEAE